MGIASLVVFSMGQIANGQPIEIAEGLTLSGNQVVIIIGIGSLAGLVKAWQGYDKSPDNFDLLKFVNGVRDNILVSLPIAFSAAIVMPDLHAVGYVMIFFAVMGGAGLGKKIRQTSIPSNATDEEIEKILESRG